MEKKTELKTQHKLSFEVAPWITPEFMRFRIGTCDGLWRSTNDSYDILAISNNNLGNGHLNDVFEWFEHSCKRDKKKLNILEVWNDNFKSHLISKRGFKDIGNDNLSKSFKTL